MHSQFYTILDKVIEAPICELDVFSELEAGSGRLAGLHIKDTKPGIFRNVPLGEGNVPFPEIFQKLTEIDFQGPLMLELLDDPTKDPQAHIQAAYDWIQAIINQKADAYLLSRK